MRAGVRECEVCVCERNRDRARERERGQNKRRTEPSQFNSNTDGLTVRCVCARARAWPCISQDPRLYSDSWFVWNWWIWGECARATNLIAILIGHIGPICRCCTTPFPLIIAADTQHTFYPFSFLISFCGTRCVDRTHHHRRRAAAFRSVFKQCRNAACFIFLFALGNETRGETPAFVWIFD